MMSVNNNFGPIRIEKTCNGKVLDLFCGAGGSAMGYSQVGYEITGVDNVPQGRYPFDFLLMDAMEALTREEIWGRFDLINASPPCQPYTEAKNLVKREYPALIPELRVLLEKTEKPYCIENVLGAPLRANLLLCGTMFSGVRTYRHRIFESNFPMVQPDHPPHVHKVVPQGRKPKDGEWIQLVGNFSGIDVARNATGMHWMTVRDMKQAIPPAYTKYIGEQFLAFRLKHIFSSSSS